MGSVFNRLIYALKFQSEQILFSDDINEESQILYAIRLIISVGVSSPKGNNHNDNDDDKNIGNDTEKAKK